MDARALYLLLGVLLGASVQAMEPLSDAEMSDVQGAGLGFVLDQVLLDGSGAQIVINDITDRQGRNVPISLKNLYLGAAGSNKGSNLNPVIIGSLDHPFELELAKGEELRTLRDDGQWVQTTPSNITVLSFKFPERLTSGGSPCIASYAGAGSNCSSGASGRADLGMRFDFQVAAGRTEMLALDFHQLVMDGSYLRLWGDRGQNGNGELVGEARINIFAKTLEVMSCAQANCNTTGETAAQRGARTLYITNGYANIALGYGKSQPLRLRSSADGQFVMELQNPTSGATTAAQRQALASDFYANAPRTNLVFENLTVGGTRSSPTAVPTGGYNFGRSEISGLSCNYLKVSSYDLR
ncbi:MAG: hypothetical protein L0G82_19595 [Pseudomonas sp.]|nr:hypothetical protein [Pseudomonas sp.]